MPLIARIESLQNEIRSRQSMPDPLMPRPELAQWSGFDAQERTQLNRDRLDQLAIGYQKLVASRRRRWLIASDFQFVYFHIPKTAGTTLHSVIIKNYRINQTLQINGPNLEANIEAALKRGRLEHVLMGHYELRDVLYQLVDRPLMQITVLRDPIRRSLSYYRYIRSEPSHPLHAKVMGMSLEDFADDPGIDEMPNGQVARLAGVMHCKERMRDPGFASEALDRAKHALIAHMGLFGLTEQFDAFLLQCARMLGWRDLFYKARNRTRSRGSDGATPESGIERIAERNAQDVALYAFAREEFARRSAAMGIDEAAVARFAQINEEVGKLSADPLFGPAIEVDSPD